MPRATKPRPIHPGEILREEFLKPLGISMNRLAAELRVPANRITQIVEGRFRITGETARRLARYFGTSAEFWLETKRTTTCKSRATSSKRRSNAKCLPAEKRPDGSRSASECESPPDARRRHTGGRRARGEACGLMGNCAPGGIPRPRRLEDLETELSCPVK
jgi:antitoxin HigA-1